MNILYHCPGSILHNHYFPSTNLATVQQHTLNFLHFDAAIDIIVIMCNKNLGPTAMRRDVYITEFLRQHLENDEGAYKRLEFR